MRGNHHRIKVMLVLAVVIASLGLVSNAAAKFMPEDTGSAVSASPPSIQITSNDGFNWGDALAGAGVAVGAALGILGTAYLLRSRSRLAT